jgi:hypothetical protein
MPVPQFPYCGIRAISGPKQVAVDAVVDCAHAGVRGRYPKLLGGLTVLRRNEHERIGEAAQKPFDSSGFDQHELWPIVLQGSPNMVIVSVDIQRQQVKVSRDRRRCKDCV